MQINVVEYFQKGALQSSKQKTAIREPGRDYTFAELEKLAKCCAALIVQRGELMREPIPVFLPKGAGNIIADLGILYSGNAYANLDIKSPPQRLKGMIQNLAPTIIITSAANAPALKEIEIPEERFLFIEDVLKGTATYDDAAMLKRLEAIIDTDPYCII